MAKEIKITLKKSNTTVVAELKDKLAPKTCKAFWSTLPIRGKATHARWGGSEIWTSIPHLENYEPESETILPAPGEILLVPAAPNVYDLAIWYGKGWCFGPSGFIPANHIATIKGDFTEFAQACERLLSEGCEEIIIERGS